VAASGNAGNAQSGALRLESSASLTNLATNLISELFVHLA